MNFIDFKGDCILRRIYTDKSIKWIEEVEDNDFAPHLLSLWLSMNDRIRIQTRWLDKYTYTLPPRMYLSLVWSILPKESRMPFCKYIKKDKSEEEYKFILDKIRHHYKMSDNDFNANKTRLIKMIDEDKESWFKFYGVEKKKWKEFEVDFEFMKEKKKKALEGF